MTSRPLLHLRETASLETLSHPAMLAALGAWRVTQNIYRFDPTLLSKLLDTKLTGDIPVDVLLKPLDFCVYVEAHIPVEEYRVHGFFAHFDWDLKHGRLELRLLIDADELLLPIPLHLTAGTVLDSINSAIDTAKTHAMGAWLLPSASAINQGTAIIKKLAEPCISLLLYLCSENADIQGKPNKIRRAHWHTYWIGSGTDKSATLKWLAPHFG